jgi:hypothetical protein
MNAVVNIRPPAESPAALARADHDAKLAALRNEEAAVLANMAKAEAVKAPITALTERRSAIQAQLAELVAADLTGEGATAHDSEALHAQLADVELETAAVQVQAQGADLALDRLRTRLADVHTRRAAEAARLTGLQRAQIDERLAGLAEGAEATAAPFLALYVEMGAVAAARDYLKLPSEPWCADVFGKTKLTLPAPFGIKAFDAFAAPRDLRPQIETRAQEILREIGVSVPR